MVFSTTASTDYLKQKLVLERQMTSLIDRAFLSRGPHLVLDRSNWVRCWVDMGHEIRAEDAVTAYRAITQSGQLLWMVRRPGRSHAYHAGAKDPFEAIEQARGAWYARKQVRRNWDDVKALRKDLLRFRRADFTVTRDDAYQAGLCRLGVEGFMRRMGCGRFYSLSARHLAFLSIFDEQAAFALYAGHLRQIEQSHHLEMPAAAPA